MKWQMSTYTEKSKELPKTIHYKTPLVTECLAYKTTTAIMANDEAVKSSSSLLNIQLSKTDYCKQICMICIYSVGNLDLYSFKRRSSQLPQRIYERHSMTQNHFVLYENTSIR